jgi:hypothetical protein
MVKQLDANHAPGFDELTGNCTIGMAGCGISTGVVMCHNNGSGRMSKCLTKNFARVK